MQPSYISTLKVLASEGSRERGVKLQYMDGKKLAKFLHFDLILRILDMVKGQIFGFFLGVGPKYGNVCHMSTFIRIVSSKGSSRSGSEMCPCRPDAAPPRPGSRLGAGPPSAPSPSPSPAASRWRGSWHLHPTSSPPAPEHRKRLRKNRFPLF